MNFCTKCGNKFEKENAFCSKCGLKLDAKNESILGLKTAKETSAKSQEGKGESVDGNQNQKEVNKISKTQNVMISMKKLLNTFFFGYVSYKFRRLIRTPIILIAIGIGILAFIEFVDRNHFPNNDKIDLVYEKYRNNTGDSSLYANDIGRDFFIKLLRTDERFLEIIFYQEGIEMDYEDPYGNVFLKKALERTYPEDWEKKVIQWDLTLKKTNAKSRYFLIENLGLHPIDWDFILIGGVSILSLFIIIGVVSFLIEPFNVKKKI